MVAKGRKEAIQPFRPNRGHSARQRSMEPTTLPAAPQNAFGLRGPLTKKDCQSEVQSRLGSGSDSGGKVKCLSAASVADLIWGKIGTLMCVGDSG